VDSRPVTRRRLRRVPEARSSCSAHPSSPRWRYSWAALRMASALSGDSVTRWSRTGPGRSHHEPRAGVKEGPPAVPARRNPPPRWYEVHQFGIDKREPGDLGQQGTRRWPRDLQLPRPGWRRPHRRVFRADGGLGHRTNGLTGTHRPGRGQDGGGRPSPVARSRARAVSGPTLRPKPASAQPEGLVGIEGEVGSNGGGSTPPGGKRPAPAGN